MPEKDTTDLRKLEYPRHLHKADGAYLVVKSVEDAERALADGWTVDVPLTDVQRAERRAFQIAAGETPDEQEGKKASGGQTDVITEMNAADAAAKIAGAHNEELVRLEAEEKANPKYAGGRKSVLDAIAARREQMPG